MLTSTRNSNQFQSFSNRASRHTITNMASPATATKTLLVLLRFILTFTITNAQGCGPLGYKATELLKPDYWYFDLNKEECSQFPKPNRYDNLRPANSTKHECRFYFHICKSMKYQCAGTACLRYLQTDDYIALLGNEVENPFYEGHSHFQSSFLGDDSLCKKSTLNFVQTTLKFNCDPKTIWNTSVVHDHGGALAPKPVMVNFDNKTCELDVHFNYTGACERFRPGEHPGKTISIGSVLLILFFPGLALYFIVGSLINRAIGHKGVDIIPHAKFWTSLPDLIMDGFVFTMSIITCRKEESRTSYESV